MSSSNVAGSSRETSYPEWATYIDDDTLAGVAPAKEPVNSILQARGDYVRCHKDEGMLIMQCNGASFHVFAPFATQTSGWARAFVQSQSASVSPDHAKEIPIPCHNWHPYYVDRVADFWTAGELVINNGMALEFAITQPNNPQDADMSDTSPMLATIYMLQYAVRLDDRALLDAALDQIKIRITTEPLDKHDFITGLQIFLSWEEEREDVALARRVLMSGLLKTGERFAPEDMNPDFIYSPQNFLDLKLAHTRGRIYYKDVFGKFGEAKHEQGQETTTEEKNKELDMREAEQAGKGKEKAIKPDIRD